MSVKGGFQGYIDPIFIEDVTSYQLSIYSLLSYWKNPSFVQCIKTLS